MAQKRPARLRGFRAHLTLWLGGLSLAVMLAVGYYLGKMATVDLTLAQGEALYGRAQAAALQLSNSLKERELEISLLSQAPHVARGHWGDPDIQASLDRRRITRPEYAWVAVTDARGTVRQATQDVLLGEDMSSRTWFQSGRHGVFVGDVHEAPELARLLPYEVADGEVMRFIDVAAPIRHNGTLVGVAVALVHWDWVWQTAQRAFAADGASPAAELWLVDRDGSVLYPSHSAGLQVLPGWPRTVRHQVARWDDGRRYLTSVAAVPPTHGTELGWRVLVRQPVEYALADTWALRNQLIFMGLLGALLITWVAYRTASRMAVPLERLTTVARQIEAGNHAPVFPPPADVLEIERLSQSLRSMTQTLLAHEHELEQKIRQRTEALEQANAELERRATTDPLTGVHNRRRLQDKLDELMRIRQRTGREFALLIADVDHFKSINDGFGHDAGDRVLQAFARVLQAQTRATDFVARYGGEEFVVVLPETPDLATAAQVAEKIRQAVAASTFPMVQTVTLSMGVTVSGALDESPDTILKRADRALYRAKAAGRNRVEAMAPTDAAPS